MKITKVASIYPWDKGLDLTSTPGSQDEKSLTRSKNVVHNSRGVLKKAPGIERLDYIGREDGNLQGIVQFFATNGSGQRSEVIRVKEGRIEVIRNNQIVDMGKFTNPSDVVTFDRFGNALIIWFENAAPQKYLIGGTPQPLNLPPAILTSPPGFSTVHQSRLWYAGRGISPHTVTVSAIGDPEDYLLLDGAFSLKISDGDGDPRGITGISPPYKGDIYVFKWGKIYRVHTDLYYGMSVVDFSDVTGCIHHNTIVNTQNDIFFVSSNAIHSLKSTADYGDAVEATISYPIYDYFQKDVNWSASKLMKATYDKGTNCYLLTYPSAGSATPNKILGFNITTKEFFQWEDINCHAFAKYWDFGIQNTLIGDNDNGLGLLNQDIATRFNQPINFKITTGVILPTKNPKSVCSFTQAWIICRPVKTTTTIIFSWIINGDLATSKTIDIHQRGTSFSGIASGKVGSAIMGSDLIGKNKDSLCIVPVTLNGEGVSIMFDIEQNPTVDDPNKPLELFGLIFEYSYNEDSEKSTVI